MNILQSVRKYSIAVLIAFASIQTLWAADLDSAKAEGLIGEMPNGYLGLVVSSAPSDVKALVADVNAKRKAKYQEVATSRNIDLSKVELIAGKKALEKTKSGHFIQVDGKWIKKP